MCKVWWTQHHQSHPEHTVFCKGKVRQASWFRSQPIDDLRSPTASQHVSTSSSYAFFDHDTVNTLPAHAEQPELEFPTCSQDGPISRASPVHVSSTDSRREIAAAAARKQRPKAQTVRIPSRNLCHVHACHASTPEYRSRDTVSISAAVSATADASLLNRVTNTTREPATCIRDLTRTTQPFRRTTVNDGAAAATKRGIFSAQAESRPCTSTWRRVESCVTTSTNSECAPRTKHRAAGQRPRVQQ